MPHYCKKCSADLDPSQTNRCAKCARLFDRTDPKTYNTSQHPSLYRPWYRFSRLPLLWSGAAVVTSMSAILVGNGVKPLGEYVYHDLMDQFQQHMPTWILAALWGALVIATAAWRKPGGLHTFIIVTAPILFTLASVAAVVLNIGLYQPDEKMPIAEYIISGIAWPAVGLWLIAAGVGWQPYLRTLPCMLVSLALAAYWYLRVFPPVGNEPQATNPLTFIAAIPFFMCLAIPVVMAIWSLFPARDTSKAPAPNRPAKTATATKRKSVGKSA